MTLLIEDDDRIIAIELKAGANGHRNSLANMKEVESKGKGLSHDLAKLSSMQKISSKPVESWLICVDLAALGIAFSLSDIESYSSLANKQGTNFAYLSQLDEEYQVSWAGKRTVSKLGMPQCMPQADAWQLIESNELWNDFFTEVARDSGPECSHVGLFYHALRRAGLIQKQAASEVFFNCNRYGTRQYYIPDFAVFDEEFFGQFQLYGNNRRTIENDQYKLPSLVSVLEFKGGDAFGAMRIAMRNEGIVKDVEKLALKIKPRIESAPSFLDRSKAIAIPKYTMVVTDSDPRLKCCIDTLRVKYKDAINIRWAGDANLAVNRIYSKLLAQAVES